VSDLDHLVFSIHALARMTERGVSVEDVRRVLDQAGPTSYDADGDYDAEVDGRTIRVVTAAHNPLFVITTYIL
jgi:hypothetical protein